jgi:hypothetical protein
MSRPFNIACIQTSSGPEIEANLAHHTLPGFDQSVDPGEPGD